MGLNKIKPKYKCGAFRKNLAGFTLVELLVAIAIIGIIAAAATAIFSESKARSRDSRRVSDVQELNNALAMYLDKYMVFPVSNAAPLPGAPTRSDGADPLSQALAVDNILEAPMLDPKDGQNIGGDTFHYYYYSENGKEYTITYCLETSSVLGKSLGCANYVSQ